MPAAGPVVTAVLAVVALAGEVPKSPVTESDAARLEALDKNGDQQLSKIEAAADRAVADTFAAADTNGDVYMSRAEYLARPAS